MLPTPSGPFARANIFKSHNCSFCKKNGESEDFYRTHKLKDENNNVTCPVLLKYTCPKCNVTGAHTASYCPGPPTRPKRRTLKQQPKPPRQPAVASNSINSSINSSINNSISASISTGINSSFNNGLNSSNNSIPPSALDDHELFQLLAQACGMVRWLRVSHLMTNNYSPERLNYVQQAAKYASWLIAVELLKTGACLL